MGDLFTDNYYSYFAEICRKNGLLASVEPYDGPFECTQVGRDADIVMGEFWVNGGMSSSCKLAAGVAHTYGKAIVGAESFTAEPSVGKWMNHPGSLKAVGETNYYDALKAALDVGDAPDDNPDFRPTPDTITFLTDGEPTKGDIVDADVLAEWYTGLNRYARVKTHTITFGLISVDTKLLRDIAERNGGRFTLVPEKKSAK